MFDHVYSRFKLIYTSFQFIIPSKLSNKLLDICLSNIDTFVRAKTKKYYHNQYNSKITLKHT